MKTLEEATKMVGVTRTDFGLRLHFSPIPNWYMKCGTNCPVCNNPIDWDWKWEGTIPQITTDKTPLIVEPILEGATLVTYGHRWIRLECNKCHTQMLAENFD